MANNFENNALGSRTNPIDNSYLNGLFASLRDGNKIYGNWADFLTYLKKNKGDDVTILMIEGALNHLSNSLSVIAEIVDYQEKYQKKENNG